MIVLVCGGRDFDNYAYLSQVLDKWHQELEFSKLIHGAAKGADSLAERWAIERNVPHQAFPADWKTYGKSAGPIRNKQMLDQGCPRVVIAFPGGSGTANMKKQTRDRNIRLISA